MIFRLLDDPVTALFFLPIFLIAITVHELAHAYTAYKLGDPTAAAMGRLTLNPIKHLDPFGFVMLLIVGFGWAKPVMINPRNFRNEKAGMAISALAGPVSNIIMAFIGLIFWNLIIVLAIRTENFDSVIIASSLTFFYLFAQLNVWFAVFNLIPIPPLDGSRLVSYFLPPNLHYYYNFVERYGFIILILLSRFALLGPIHSISGWILQGMDAVLYPLFSLFM